MSVSRCRQTDLDARFDDGITALLRTKDTNPVLQMLRQSRESLRLKSSLVTRSSMNALRRDRPISANWSPTSQVVEEGHGDYFVLRTDKVIWDTSNLRLIFRTMIVNDVVICDMSMPPGAQLLRVSRDK